MGSKPVLGRLVACGADLPEWSTWLAGVRGAAHARSIAYAVGAPKSEPPVYASGSSVSGQLLVMCVLGACGVAGTVYGSCACEMGLLDALVIATCTITQITHVHICVICETDMARASGSERWWKMRTPPFCNLRTVRK